MDDTSNETAIVNDLRGAEKTREPDITSIDGQKDTDVTVGESGEEIAVSEDTTLKREVSLLKVRITSLENMIQHDIAKWAEAVNKKVTVFEDHATFIAKMRAELARFA